MERTRPPRWGMTHPFGHPGPVKTSRAAVESARHLTEVYLASRPRGAAEAMHEIRVAEARSRIADPSLRWLARRLVALDDHVRAFGEVTCDPRTLLPARHVIGQMPPHHGKSVVYGLPSWRPLTRTDYDTITRIALEAP